MDLDKTLTTILNNAGEITSEVVSRSMNFFQTILDNKKKAVLNIMHQRFELEVSTYDGEGWERLSPNYVKYHRKYPEKPKLVQSGSIKPSIKVHTTVDPEGEGDSFFYATGNEKAVAHNKGYSFNTGKVIVEVPARPCLEIPFEYAVGGYIEKRILDELVLEHKKILKEVVLKYL